MVSLSSDYRTQKSDFLQAYQRFIFSQCFRDAIKAAQAYKNNSTDFMDEIMKELDVSTGSCHVVASAFLCYFLTG